MYIQISECVSYLNMHFEEIYVNRYSKAGDASKYSWKWILVVDNPFPKRIPL